MIAANVLTYTGLVLIEMTIVVQIHMKLPPKKQVLICSSEITQLPSQVTNVSCHIQKQLKIVDTTLTVTITMIDEVIIRM